MAKKSPVPGMDALAESATQKPQSQSSSSSSTQGTQPPGVGAIPPPPSIIFPEIEIPPAAPPPPPPPPVPTGGQTALRVSDALRKKFRATSLADQNRKVGRPSTILTGPQGSTGSVSSPTLSGTLFG